VDGGKEGRREGYLDPGMCEPKCSLSPAFLVYSVCVCVCMSPA